MLPKPSHSNIFQHKVCSYSPSNWHCEDANASPRLLTVLCTVAILIRPHPSFSTELKPLGTAQRRSACVCHSIIDVPPFQRVAKHHEQGKQATHLAGGEEEGEGTSEDAHGWVLCGVQNFNNEGRGRKQGRRCWSLSFWSGGAFSRVAGEGRHIIGFPELKFRVMS